MTENASVSVNLREVVCGKGFASGRRWTGRDSQNAARGRCQAHAWGLLGAGPQGGDLGGGKAIGLHLAVVGEDQYCGQAIAIDCC